MVCSVLSSWPICLSLYSICRRNRLAWPPSVGGTGGFGVAPGCSSNHPLLHRNNSTELTTTSTLGNKRATIVSPVEKLRGRKRDGEKEGDREKGRKERVSGCYFPYTLYVRPPVHSALPRSNSMDTVFRTPQGSPRSEHFRTNTVTQCVCHICFTCKKKWQSTASAHEKTGVVRCFR